MYKSRLRSGKKNQENFKTYYMKSQDLSMKSRLNNSSDMSAGYLKPSFDSLIHKPEINELKMI